MVGSTVENPIEDPAFAPPEVPPGVGKPPAGTVAIAVDRDHPVRYAAASGDNNPIHLDAAYARNAGFPGPITHGMCTLALAANALEERHPGLTRSSALSIEFTRPVFPGDRLTVRYDQAPGVTVEGGLALRFEVLNRKMRTVMRGGTLHLQP